jgi:hypothetical protein
MWNTAYMNAVLEQLRAAGGASSHPTSSLSVHQFRVVLRGVSPLIWRRLLVRSDSSIADLHATLQLDLSRLRIVSVPVPIGRGQIPAARGWGWMPAVKTPKTFPLIVEVGAHHLFT